MTAMREIFRKTSGLVCPKLLLAKPILKGKRVVVTSGGTISPIDDVRHIGNFSSGEFPARIAESCLLSGAETIYLHAKGARLPFLKGLSISPSRPLYKELARMLPLRGLFKYFERNGLLRFVEIATVPEYADALKNILGSEPIDIVFLGMAVSDYGFARAPGKISSSAEELTLTLTRNMKVIKQVKDWTKDPVFQIGFKLLSGAPVEDLINTAYLSLIENHSNLILANDLAEIRKGERAAYLVTPEKGAIKFGPGGDMAGEIVNFVAKRSKTTHFKTGIAGEAKISEEFPRIFAEMKKWGEIFSRIEFMTPYVPGDKRLHGSLAVRIPGTNKFIITSRNSNKSDLSDRDVVVVESADFNSREISLRSLNGIRGSLNVPLVAAIFRKFISINAIVHTHNGLADIPTTEFPFMPGTTEYVEEAMKILSYDAPLIMLKDHGLLAIGKDLAEASKILLSRSLKRYSARSESHAYRDFPEMYDLIYKTFSRNLGDFIELTTRGLTPGSKILDAAAGTGQAALELAKNGFAVTAADLNQPMLNVLEAKRKERGLPEIAAVNVSFLDLKFQEEFDAVIARQSINYLIGFENLVEGLKRFRAALRQGGKLVFNAPNYHPGQDEFPPKMYEVREGNMRGIVNEWNRADGNVLTHHHDCAVWDEARKRKPRFLNDVNIFQMYSAAEFIDALKKAGFSKITLYSSGLKPFAPEDKSLYAEAIK